LSGTGILYVTTANNASGDIDNNELAIIDTHGLDIARFVTGGGGLFSHAESPGFRGGGTQPTPYGWLTSIFPGIIVVQESSFSLTGVTITPEGMRAFPGLT